MFTIIIPVFNEEFFLPRILSQLSAYHPLKIIVIDGGSTDQTCALAKNFNVELIHSSIKSRSIQMNLGAQNADSEYLLFLHADIELPDYFFEVVEAFIQKKGKLANFSLQFDSRHWFLTFSAFFTIFRASSFQFGDQGLLITKELFEKIGAFDESRTLIEDQDLIRRAKKVAKLHKLPAKLKVSARKYERFGTYYLQFCYVVIVLCYRLGFDDKKLQKVLKILIGTRF